MEYNQVDDVLAVWYDYDKYYGDVTFVDLLVPVTFVHELQQVLRLAGLSKLADNFEI